MSSSSKEIKMAYWKHLWKCNCPLRDFRCPGRWRIEFFWVVTPCSVSVEYQRFRGLHPKDGGSRELWKVIIHYTAPQPRRPRPESYNCTNCFVRRETYTRSLWETPGKKCLERQCHKLKVRTFINEVEVSICWPLLHVRVTQPTNDLHLP
jgi:hypothetical protein